MGETFSGIYDAHGEYGLYIPSSASRKGFFLPPERKLRSFRFDMKVRLFQFCKFSFYSTPSSPSLLPPFLCIHPPPSPSSSVPLSSFISTVHFIPFALSLAYFISCQLGGSVREGKGAVVNIGDNVGLFCDSSIQLYIFILLCIYYCIIIIMMIEKETNEMKFFFILLFIKKNNTIEVRKIFKMIRVQFPLGNGDDICKRQFIMKTRDKDTAAECISRLTFNFPFIQVLQSPTLFVFRGPMINNNRLLWNVPLPPQGVILKNELQVLIIIFDGIILPFPSFLHSSLSIFLPFTSSPLPYISFYLP